MTPHPDSPKDQSPSTLADRLEYAIATASNDDYTLPGTIERQRHCDRLEAMRDAMEYLRGAALRSPTREAARSEALKEAARGSAPAGRALHPNVEGGIAEMVADSERSEAR